MVLYGGGDGAMFDMLSSGAVLLWIDDEDAVYLVNPLNPLLSTLF